jgi:ABC-type transport system involved in multi-copper enzyme maturation permease subunit
MLPGPVFNVELLTTARRARYYAVRVLYGLILLFVLWQMYSSYFYWRTRNTNNLSIHDMSEFAHETFAAIGVAQLIAVLALTPTLVAGVISDEKQRKTLHYLLASRLTSAEIVLGKLAARLLHVGVFLALALPIVSLIGLFGGVDPELVLYTYAGTFTTAFFLAGLSIWISTIARRVRDAIFAVYLLEIAWLALPVIVVSIFAIWPRVWRWFQPISEWILATNPFYTLMQALNRFGAGGPALLARFLFMAALQVGFGMAFVVLALWRLRPIFQAQGGEVKRPSWFERRVRRPRFLLRPDCGDDPMLWKERYFTRSGKLVRWVVRILSLCGGVIMAYWILYFAGPAIQELWQYGYGWAGRYTGREELNYCLRTCGTILYVLWMLGVGAAAASGITSEKEEDTWISLTTTTLTGTEILNAKMLGAVWSMRRIAYAVFGLWAFGVAIGAIHPFGLLAEMLEWTVFTWFATALGTFTSLKSRTTIRATATTVVVLALLNVGYMMCCVPFRPDTPMIMVGCTPAIVAISLMSFGDLWGLLGFVSAGYRRQEGELVATCVLSLVGYAVAAIALTALSISGFDKAVDRPKRTYWGEPQPQKLPWKAET